LFCLLQVQAQISPLCTVGQTWHGSGLKTRGGTQGLKLSGRGDKLALMCLSGWKWDSWSDRTAFSLRVYQDATFIQDITDKINMTSTRAPFEPLVLTGPNPNGQWGLEVKNDNSFWSAYYTLVFWPAVLESSPSCSSCQTAGLSGANCDVPCSSKCFACCQNDPNTCTVCRGNRTGVPSCEFQCPSQCLACDNMGGCTVCAEPARFGPDCTQCPPQPCRNVDPFRTNCSSPCNDYRWCDLCGNVVEALRSIYDIVGTIYKNPTAAAAAIATAKISCLLATEIFAPACDFSVALLEDGVSWMIVWLGKRFAEYLSTKAMCGLIGLCPTTPELAPPG